MNKFIGQKIIIKKWQTQPKAILVQTPWIVFEKGYLQRNADELAKIRNVKDDLRALVKNFDPAYSGIVSPVIRILSG